MPRGGTGSKTGDRVVPGQVLIAPGDAHMRLLKVNGEYQVECRSGPKVNGHCPSVDVLFESVAKAAGAGGGWHYPYRNGK
mgnify:CR=1 FL=1